MKTLLLALAFAAGAAHAASVSAVGRLVDLNVYDRTSQRTLPVYRHDGRYYIAGEPGHLYQIGLRNRAGADVMAVLSVDAVNVISGDTADWSQTGYVLDPYADADVLGWRKSTSQVADFVFADFAQSYAVRTGRPDNVGVIGVAVFRRHRAYIQPVIPAPVADAASQDAYTSGSVPAPAEESIDRPTAGSMAVPQTQASMNGAAMAKAPAGGPLGTGHGQREESSITYVDFERASSAPDEVITLYYDTWDHLLARGIVQQRRPAAPQPFHDHFVPDP
ncbi:hypothetical protein B0E47_11965 [Rhodanobacter sp. B05]|uniref:hypothetical protein n=1 Tax=Rhodanobacter sp. B05 TaxID=1945859 RepID=UPI000984893C|nr:hypothetical protein [Rhodanobacter sp. B05]OOG53904.1 hypothetical protein B0E47_11965 [Rhodanobacter sp. B05]